MKRYVLDSDEDSDGFLVPIGMVESPDGGWVKWEDVYARVAELERIAGGCKAARDRLATERNAANARSDATERRPTLRAQLTEVRSIAAEVVAERKALRAEVERLRAELRDGDDADRDMRDLHVDTLKQFAAANALIAKLAHWADVYGSALVPHGGAADTFGDGVRYCKRQVKDILSGQAPAR